MPSLCHLGLLVSPLEDVAGWVQGPGYARTHVHWEGWSPQPSLAWWEFCSVSLGREWRNRGMMFCLMTPCRPQPGWDSGLVIQAQRTAELNRDPRHTHTHRAQHSRIHRDRVRSSRHHSHKNEHFTQMCSVSGFHSDRSVYPKKTRGGNNWPPPDQSGYVHADNRVFND